MNKLHMTAIAAIVAGAVTVGGVAISTSGGSSQASTGAAPSAAAAHSTAERAAALDALEASLDRQLAEAAATPPVQAINPPVGVSRSGSHDEGDDHGGWERDEHESGDD
jgi:hypothetical protein